MKKISIVTPCYNAEKYIKETIKSVINQTAVLSGRVELEYIICDGKSSDKTIDMIEELKCEFIQIMSEKDIGMYNALSKGLKQVSGDIVAYINAGDYYHKCAFDVVIDIFEQKKVNWLTGFQIFYNENSYALPGVLPYIYRKRFFECGIYLNNLPQVQQESTFWSSHLNEHIDFDYLSSLKLAGDFYLWRQFSQVETLKIVEAYLGGFKIQKGQLSENKEAYYQEVSQFIDKANIIDLLLARFDKTILFYAPTRIKKKMNQDGILIFDHKLAKWV